MKNKVGTVQDALEHIENGQTIMCAGFTNVGSANHLIRAIADAGYRDFHIIANDAGNDHADGIGTLICERRAKSLIASHVGLNPEVGRQMAEGVLDVTLVPQGTLAERIRCGGAGLGGVLTPTGVGTIVEEGKQAIELNGKKYLLETPLRAQVGLVKAWKADTCGNLVYHRLARNFNPMVAMACDYVIAEVEEVVQPGEIDPDEVMTPGVCVDLIVPFREVDTK